MEHKSNAVRQSDVKFDAALLMSWVGGFLPIESGPIWIPATVAHYHTSAVTVGAIASLQLLLSAAVALLLAPRLGSGNPRQALMIGIAIVATSAACSMVHLPFVAFAGLRIAEGAGAGLCIAVGGMLASRTASPTQAFGFLQLGQITGTVVVFSVAAPLVSRFGSASIYAVVLTAAIVALGLLVKRPDWSAYLSPAVSDRKSATRRGDLWLSCSCITVVFCAFIGVVTSAGVLGAHAGLSLGQIGIALALTTPAGACASVASAVIGTRIDRRWLLAASICGAFTSGVLLAFTVDSVQSLALAIGSLTFSVYLAVPIIFATVSTMQSRGGTPAAAAQAAQMLGVALGPITGAWIISQSLPALGLTAGGGVAIGLGLAMHQFARNPLPRQQRVPKAPSLTKLR